MEFIVQVFLLASGFHPRAFVGEAHFPLNVLLIYDILECDTVYSGK